MGSLVVLELTLPTEPPRLDNNMSFNKISEVYAYLESGGKIQDPKGIVFFLDGFNVKWQRPDGTNGLDYGLHLKFAPSYYTKYEEPKVPLSLSDKFLRRFNIVVSLDFAYDNVNAHQVWRWLKEQEGEKL